MSIFNIVIARCIVFLTSSCPSVVKEISEDVYSLEPPLAVLALVSNPSSVTETGSVYAFSSEAVLLTHFRRRGVREEHKVKQDVHHQVSADSPQFAVGSFFGSKRKELSLTFPSRIHV